MRWRHLSARNESNQTEGLRFPWQRIQKGQAVQSEREELRKRIQNRKVASWLRATATS